MLHFIKSQPEVVPKLLLHMSTSSIMDLLLKIISMEESPEGKGTVQVNSEKGYPKKAVMQRSIALFRYNCFESTPCTHGHMHTSLATKTRRNPKRKKTKYILSSYLLLWM